MRDRIDFTDSAKFAQTGIVENTKKRSEEDYWELLSRISKDHRCRLFRTDHISKHHTVYNLVVWKPQDPFVRITAKTICMMECS
jgi:hypothetical protein